MEQVWVTARWPGYKANVILAPAMTQSAPARRPLKTRDKGWAKAVAGILVRMGVSPNAISVGSIFFALTAGGAFFFSPPPQHLPPVVVVVFAAADIPAPLLRQTLV